MNDLGTNVAALLHLISHYRLTSDIKKNNATLLKTIGSQIGTDHFGKPSVVCDGLSNVGTEDSVAVLAAMPSGPDMEIYTDGACICNPGGDGGWGFVAVRDGKMVAEHCGPDPKTTSNRAELKAVIRGLLWLAPGSPATIVSDSQYVVKVLSGEHRAKANLDMIEEARVLMQERSITFRWVRGHAGNRWNERADALAARGMGKSAPRKVRKKIMRPGKRQATRRTHADLRRRAAQDGIPYCDSLPRWLIP